jgi:hypothetical protein
MDHIQGQYLLCQYLKKKNDLEPLIESIQNLSERAKILTESSNTSSIKYKLPTQYSISETKNFLTFQLGINNYVKDSIRVKIESENSLNLICESCSLSGCYVEYFSINIELSTAKIDSDLISNKSLLITDFNKIQTASWNFNEANKFELKLKKIENLSKIESNNTAMISLNKIDEKKW